MFFDAIFSPVNEHTWKCDKIGYLSSFSLGLILLYQFYIFSPDLVNMDKVRKSDNKTNLENAFAIAEKELGITRLLDPEGNILFSKLSILKLLCI